MKTDIRRTESSMKSPDWNWIANKGATINPKNERDNKCFQYSITSALNYNKIKNIYLKKIEKLKWVDVDFSSHQRNWEEFQKTILQLLLMSYLHHSTVKK